MAIPKVKIVRIEVVSAMMIANLWLNNLAMWVDAGFMISSFRFEK